jgi:hypothetical protein
MRYGISNLSIVPMRSEPREDSQMCSQILFGEHYTIIQVIDKWCRIALAFDGYEGWVDRKMINEIDEKYFLLLDNVPHLVTVNLVNRVQIKSGSDSFFIVAGSSLPHFKPFAQTFKLGKMAYKLKPKMKNVPEGSIRERMIQNALSFFNVPYLWGGRTPFGIDCSGFSQVLYKMAGIQIPRDAAQQALIGENLSFVEETLPGDLAFFDNDEGAIIHVGIIWIDKKIIHASGKVRIDKVDQFGIYNVDTKRYTHQMRLMRRIIKDKNEHE